jgi:hypothetical protein
MAERTSSVATAVLEAPVRTSKGDPATRRPLQKLKGQPDAGAVINTARANANLEPKQMAGLMGISHSLVLRGLKGEDHLSFHRLWELSDDFWAELLIAIAKKRRVALVRVSIDLDRRGRDGR